jgi:hypothetical protein
MSDQENKIEKETPEVEKEIIFTAGVDDEETE